MCSLSHGSATGFRPILNNFYEQIADGYVTICETINENPNSSAVDIKTFLNMSFDEPDEQDRSLHYKWQVRVAIYKALLYTRVLIVPQITKFLFPLMRMFEKLWTNQLAAQTI